MPKKSNIRKTAAIGLAFLGLAGVTVASAATLALDGGNESLVQANTVAFSGSPCQTSTIFADFSLAGVTPGSLATGGPFGYPGSPDSVRLTGIDSGPCANKVIKVALGNATDSSLGEFTSTVTAATLNLSLAAGGDFGAVVNPADITQISVTIYD